MQQSGSSGIAQSEGSANQMINVVLMPEMILPIEHQLAFTRPVFGPIEPPCLTWERSSQVIIPTVLAANIPRSLYPNVSLFRMLSKRSWVVAFDMKSDFQCKEAQQEARVVVHRKKRPVARVLIFEPMQDAELKLDGGQSPTFCATATPVRKRRPRKIVTTEEIQSARRSVRLSAKAKGSRCSVLNTPAKKKPMCAKVKEVQNGHKKQQPGQSKESAEHITPHTPVHVLQQVGRVLQIPEEERAEDRLEAHPQQDKPSNNHDD